MGCSSSFSKRKSFSVCHSIVPSPPIRAVISRIVNLFLTVSQKPLHDGSERVDERFIRKLCLMFQFPDIHYHRAKCVAVVFMVAAAGMLSGTATVLIWHNLVKTKKRNCQRQR